MKRLNRHELTASIPFPHDWQRKGILSLYRSAGITPGNHLLPVYVGERKDLPKGDR